MIAIGLDDEGEKVAEVHAPDSLKLEEKVVARSAEANVDVACSSRALQSELEDDAPLQDRAIAEVREHAGETFAGGIRAAGRSAEAWPAPVLTRSIRST